ncbi:phosphoglycerate kinase [Corynebacterium diphtheriae]|uniref:phosphoglycerate kinase n=1 Tax=Corynebacterium diphtheriae TaxID=1717 RepID=UPI000B4B1848|nr:phosphoglycerate kinase [Corynebacterium diphtheriae]OWN36234.1 phosphoglycerate kinase [Corynebacterium diphtheriae bv. gravis]OWN71022.1 phosphoglycerate kinase [Corynebacterium diphtheriae bv. gravis]OWO19507.1 phosphoglycerate kinase [Corynebacterium diphtheriae bv. gravis]OWO53139.1 phosphoglycerate kinase [Corynebacterium diphtheriae bv. gravis]UEB75558.1 phosphoglycerate kinase [Corynebacterium diphtheriae]
MAIKTLKDLLAEGVEGRHVLVRSDFNVPLNDDREITDAGRITASLPTIKALVDNGARVILMAHLGRPKGEVNEKFSLAPVAEALSEALGQYVALAGDVVGEDAHERANGLNDGDVLLLENVRFDPRETSKEEAERGEFADQLVALTAENGAFVSDGFGVVHRAQASVFDVAQRLPHYAGTLVEKELEVLGNKVASAPERPYAVILGGAKVSDKLGVIEALATKADKLIIGGGMCYTFLAAKGINVQKSLLQEEQINKCKELLEAYADKIVLPVDLVAAAEFASDAENKIVAIDEIPEGWMSLDVGPKTVEKFAEVLATSKTVFWNGPMGVFEFENFSAGTRVVAEAIIAATANGAFSVVGGGDSAAAVRLLGLDEDGFSHISTGGGASLELLEGKNLPGVSVLES